MSSEHAASSWPAEMLFLLERHPRSSWPAEPSSNAAFWLEVHDHLRRDCAGLVATTDDHRAGRTSAAQLAAIAPARLRGLVARMTGHHQIEDFHYFPAFRRAEPRLASGFDRLESDHARLARDVAAAEAALGELCVAAGLAVRGRADSAVALAAERYFTAAQRLSTRLRDHLADEEDLVVPLLIETRGP